MARGETVKVSIPRIVRFVTSQWLEKRVYSRCQRKWGKYFRFDLLWNREGTGYIQRLALYEEAIFETFNPVIDKWYEKGSVDISELSELYSKMDIGAAVK